MKDKNSQNLKPEINANNLLKIQFLHHTNTLNFHHEDQPVNIFMEIISDL